MNQKNFSFKSQNNDRFELVSYLPKLISLVKYQSSLRMMSFLACKESKKTFVSSSELVVSCLSMAPHWCMSITNWCDAWLFHFQRSRRVAWSKVSESFKEKSSKTSLRVLCNFWSKSEMAWSIDRECRVRFFRRHDSIFCTFTAHVKQRALFLTEVLTK